MSDSLYQQPIFPDERAAAEGPDSVAHAEPPPVATGVGRAQRSEPERSDGERSGARPTPASSPSSAPEIASPKEGETNVPYDEEASNDDRGAELPPRLRLTGRSKGRRL